MRRVSAYTKRLAFAFLICLNSLLLTGCYSQQLTNQYNNFNINAAKTDYEGSISESSVNRVETFSKTIAILPQSFHNTFDYNSDVGEMLLVNTDTNEILYSEHSMQKIAPASTTKLMTAYIVLNQCNLDDSVTVSHDISLEDGAVALFIGKGDTITVDELLHAMLIESANDCAVVLAEYVSGSVKAFAELMNETAVSIGATHSHFMNPHGLDEDGHYSCAYDLYLILQKDLENEHFRDIVSTASYTVRYTDENGEEVKCPITTTNQYFKGNYDVPNGITILGGKTGTTSNAGHCLVLASTNREGQSLIGVVLNATDNNQLYDTMSHLLSENQ